MALSKESLEQVANLARIELSGKEIEQFSHQLQQIIDFIDQLKTIDIKEISPTSHVLALKNVLREDKPSGSLPVEKALKNAPEKKNNYFLVPKIIE